MQDPRFFPLLLHRLPNVGPATFSALVNRFGSAQSALHQSSSVLAPLVSSDTLQAIVSFARDPLGSVLAEKVCADLSWLDSRPDAHLVLWEDPNYPDLLREIAKPPPLLFVLGDPTCLSLPQLAMVGSRNPSSGGAANAQRFATHLAANGFVITSGLALGVDAAAHEGAIAAQGKTIAVMGTGIDTVYPARHRTLAQRILASGGALVSEFPLGSAAQPSHFPQRNRIISGLSLGVLVVEAARQSGSLITAKAALQQNREVFAIPGSIHNPLARGCHELIRQGATLVETAQDIVEQLGGMLSYERELLLAAHNPDYHLQQAAIQRAQSDAVISEGCQDPNLLTPAEQQLCCAIGFDPVTIDELVERTGATVGSIMAQLVSLEIKGFIKPLGSAYQRV